MGWPGSSSRTLQPSLDIVAPYRPHPGALPEVAAGEGGGNLSPPPWRSHGLVGQGHEQAWAACFRWVLVSWL